MVMRSPATGSRGGAPPPPRWRPWPWRWSRSSGAAPPCSSTDSLRPPSRTRGGGIDGVQRHLLAAAAGRQQPDAGLHQAHVELGVHLAAHGVQGDLRAAAEAEAERRRHHRTRAELDGRRHPLEGADGEVDVVPLLFLHAQQKLHQVGAHREVVRVAADDEGREVAHGVAVRRAACRSPGGRCLRRWRSSCECSSRQATPSPRSTSEAPAILLHHAVRRAERRHARHAFGHRRCGW